MYKRLTGAHPTTIKLIKLETLAESLQIRLVKTEYGFNIEDLENNLTVQYSDLEQGYHCYNHSPYCFPHECETKLVYEVEDETD